MKIKMNVLNFYRLVKLFDLYGRFSLTGFRCLKLWATGKKKTLQRLALGKIYEQETNIVHNI
jgi:hypothetical protein